MFQERIRDTYDRLTPGFRRLADFIMNNTLDTAFLTATRLARRVDVDPATVVRFSQDLGYSGYRELSREIKDYVRTQITATSKKVVEADDDISLLQSLYDSTLQNAQQFMATEKEKLIEAVKLLHTANHVWITGEGASYELAKFLGKLLGNLHIASSVFSPGMVDASQSLSAMKEGDLLLSLAIGAPSIDGGYTMHQAREKGVNTMCVADSPVTLPTREAELVITLPAQNALGYPGFALVGMLLGLMWETLAGQDPEVAKQATADAKGHMSKFLELRAQTEAFEIT